MNRMRTWSLGAAGLAFLVLVAGWFLLISPTKAKVSDLQTQTASQMQTNIGLETQLAAARRCRTRTCPKQEAKLAKIRQHLPATPALPTYVRTLTKIAHDSGVKLVLVTPTPPVVVTAQAPAPVVTPSASSSSADGAAPTKTLLRLRSQSPTGLKQIPVSITVSGGYYNIVQLPDQGRGPQAIDARLQHQHHTGRARRPLRTARPDSAEPAQGVDPNAHLLLATRCDTPRDRPRRGATPASSGAAAPRRRARRRRCRSRTSTVAEFATQEPPAETPDAPDTGSRRNLVIVGIAVAVALLVAVWFLFLVGGRQLDADRSGAQASLKADGPGKTTVKKRPARRPRLSIKPAADKDTEGRDPFKALIKEPPQLRRTSRTSRRRRAQPSTSTPATSPSASVPDPAGATVVGDGQPAVDRQQGQDGDVQRRDHRQPGQVPGHQGGRDVRDVLQGVRPRHQVRPGAVRRRDRLGLHGHPPGGPRRILIAQQERISRPERLAPTSGDQPLVHGRIAACCVG